MFLAKKNFSLLIVAIGFLSLSGLANNVAAAPTALGQGSCAKVINSNSAGGLAVRVNPSTNGYLVYRMPDGTKVRVTGSSITFGGYTWWPHAGMQRNGQAGRVAGWSAGSYLQETDCTGVPSYNSSTQLNASHLRRDGAWVNGFTLGNGSEPAIYMDTTLGKPGQFPLASTLTSSPSMRNKNLYESIIGLFAVGDNPQNRYAKDSYTYCNTFAGDVMRAMGVPLPIKSSSDPATKGAYDLYLWLLAGNNWTRIYPNSSSQDLNTLINHVNAGKPALAAYGTSSINAHIAVIRPQSLPSNWRDLRMAQAGATNSNNIALKDVWGTTTVPAFFIRN